MREACSLIWTALVRLFRTRASLVAEILVLRHQINIQRRHLPKRQTFRIMDRLIFAGLYRLAPNVLNALAILTTHFPDFVSVSAHPFWWRFLAACLRIQKFRSRRPGSGAKSGRTCSRNSAFCAAVIQGSLVDAAIIPN